MTGWTLTGGTAYPKAFSFSFLFYSFCRYIFIFYPLCIHWYRSGRFYFIFFLMGTGHFEQVSRWFIIDNFLIMMQNVQNIVRQKPCHHSDDEAWNLIVIVMTDHLIIVMRSWVSTRSDPDRKTTPRRENSVCRHHHSSTSLLKPRCGPSQHYRIEGWVPHYADGR